MLIQNLLNALITPFIALAPLAFIVWIILYTKKQKARSRKNPINAHLLRGPGHSLIEKIEEIVGDLYGYFIIIPYIFLSIYIAYLSSSKSLLIQVCFTLSLVSCITFITRKVITLTLLKEKLKLGYEAELAVGQELNLLMRQGYYVYHDVNLRNTISEFNIDHVVVGKSGVFAVETKGRSKRINSDGEYTFRVSFDGKKLSFPEWEETKPVEQAKRQAYALQGWLSKAVGEPVNLKAVIALPGWFVTTTRKTEITLINGKNPENAFNASSDDALSQKQVRQIAHQLECLCRNIEPKAYRVTR